MDKPGIRDKAGIILNNLRSISKIINKVIFSQGLGIFNEDTGSLAGLVNKR